MIADEKEVVFQPEGDLVAASVPELRARLRELVGDGARTLVIDLEQTRMVDSVGIGLLIATHNSLRKVGGQVSVVRASADIVQLLTTMRIHQHFPVSGQ
ncbi:MAG: STAS domain-containing protein [Bryobacteraceae bacterium]|nr:STAS domain-containing protein [Bryobacteraceae bacterium]